MDERVGRARRNTRQPRPGRTHPIGTPEHGLAANTGALAAAMWLVERGLSTADPRWFVEVALEVPGRDTRFQLDIYNGEWGIQLHHDDRSSWIRVTDVPFVHGRDDHRLLARAPRLSEVHRLLADLERDFGVTFDRDTPRIRSSIPDAYPVVRSWIASM